jgi:hypothetical protein
MEMSPERPLGDTLVRANRRISFVAPLQLCVYVHSILSFIVSSVVLTMLSVTQPIASNDLKEINNKMEEI